MNEKQMSDKQYNCIKWICDILDIDYNGTSSSYDAWKFIKDNKSLADKKSKEQEHSADLFILQAMESVGYPKYQCTLNTREIEYDDNFDGINLDDDDIDTICPGGIHCADDIKEYGWMYALRDNPYL